MSDPEDFLMPNLKNEGFENDRLFEYVKAYQSVVNQFGYEPVIQPGRISLLGWDLEYRCGATLANFIDQIMVRRLNDFVPANDHPLILDCGANIGFSVLNYKHQFPHARVIAFEPDPEFVPVLKRNLERNDASDVEVIDAAVWIDNGTSQWYCEGIDGSHLSSEAGKGSKPTIVRTIDLGDYLNEPVDLIKLDIEGAEYEVVRYLGKKLKNVKAMSIECHVDQGTIIPFGEMLKSLKEAGFQLSINSFGAWRDLIRQAPVSADHHENYILVSAWRGSITESSAQVSWIPSAGVAPLEFLEREAKFLRYLKAFISSGKKALKRLTLKKPYRRELGKSWFVPLAKLKHIADDEEHHDRSSLLLYEDEKLLQPAHALHEDIRNRGEGCYSHWRERLYFSTSDGSDPNRNGREYRIIYIEG
jgi:FkbM family methyltransferase